MKRKNLLFLLLALMAPWAAMAQSATETFTLYENETLTNNSYIPLYGLWGDADQQSEFIIPASELEDLKGGTISKLTFYLQSVTNANMGGTAVFYLKEVDVTTFESPYAYFGTDGATQVYSGGLDTHSSTAVEVPFTSGVTYTYNGGNLLVGMIWTTSGDYKSTTWLGKSATGASISHYSTYSPSLKSFIPKTTFTFVPGPYRKPANLEYTNVDPTTTNLTWNTPDTEATLTGYAYSYKKSTEETWPADVQLAANATSLELNPLDSYTEYNFRIKSLYGTTSSVYAKVTFTTLDNCMTPENLTITDVTPNSATFNWTEGFGNGQWKFGYKTGNDDYTYMDIALADLPLTLDIFEENTTYSVEVYPLCDPTKKITDQFNTRCEPIDITALPNNTWAEDFTDYSNGTFTDNCWENKHISGNGTSLFQIAASQAGYTKVMQLPDQNLGTLTKLMLPAMILPNSNYHFVLDVYRSNSTYNDSYAQEGIRVFASANGEIQGATEITFIPRQYTVSSTLIPAETAVGWYTYELPINMSGLCYIILQGESQYCTATYMDNFSVEPIPACGRPSGLTYSNRTNHSVKLSWSAPEGQDAWQIAYSKTSFDPNADNFDISTVALQDANTNPYTFDKTLDADAYYMYVRGNCGNDGYSKWTKTGVNVPSRTAAPAPTAVTVTDVWSSTANVYWTAGGGDFETSWDLYYVKKVGTDTPTAPTAETQATETVTTLPTAENPYTIENLDAESTYYLWVRANHNNDGYSAWTKMTGSSFTTTPACDLPANLAAENVGHYNADITWDGDPTYQGTYTVEYQTAANTQILASEDFNSGLPTSWTLIDYDQDGNNWFESSFTTSACMESDSYSGGALTPDNWMITNKMVLGTKVGVYAAHYSSYPETFGIFYSLNDFDSESFDPEGFIQLGSDFTTTSSSTMAEFTVNVPAEVIGQQAYIAIRHYNSTDNWKLYIDDFTMYGQEIPEGDWVTATNNTTATTWPLEGLAMGTKYNVRVKANCGEDYATTSFTTLDENTKIFTTAGDWNVAGNWEPEGEPTVNQDVIIKTNATIPSGCIAEALSITVEGTPEPTLTIEDGGQLRFFGGNVTATVKKTVTGYGNNTGISNYYLLASPVEEDLDPTEVPNMINAAGYDLYAFDGTQVAEEWQNYKADEFDIEQGNGYLYANKDDATLEFTGTLTPLPGSGYIHYVNGYLPYTSGAESLQNWSLVGNPHPCDAYIVMCTYSGGYSIVNNYADFYRMNDDHNEIIAGTGAVAPMEAIFAVSGASNFVAVSSASALRGSYLNLNLSQGNSLIDVARIRFAQGEGMEKIQLDPNHTKLYIQQDNKDYSVVYSEEEGEMPVSFKAEKNGTYTLSFANEEVTFGYLHLIDNLTGMDVNLLETPSYSFEAKTTDYASRFKLVFATGSNANDESFAFMSDGNLIVNNEGEATLQVIDVNGRILRSESINGSASINMNTVPGVYMIRVINGENVKTQKMVVR